jgi:hypothetical protein
MAELIEVHLFVAIEAHEEPVCIFGGALVVGLDTRAG